MGDVVLHCVALEDKDWMLVLDALKRYGMYHARRARVREPYPKVHYGEINQEILNRARRVSAAIAVACDAPEGRVFR